ncbi:glycosyltransferase [Paracoccus nototheniae]|uniref:Glycosyltransferase n=1 Tax=Paracoccus nototheniae TaxID=2489002 RepID=A0ABW4DU85_9RHOB|nr:glycosyltransferase [Paracoccus nototheniae]
MKPRLILVPSVHVVRDAEGLRMDDKFIEGIRMFAREWDGPVRVVIREYDGALPFSRRIDPADLPCELRVIGPEIPITPEDLQGGDIVLAAADDFRQMSLPPVCAAVGARLVYAIEYDLATRMAVSQMDLATLRPLKRLLRTLRAKQWLLSHERRLRRALRAADGVQANGFPAWTAYRGLSASPCLYLDGRMSRDAMATPADQARRAAQTGPLRIVHAGRLIAMKGSQDLVPFAQALRDEGVDFTLDIFGTGPMRAPMAADLARLGLGGEADLPGGQPGPVRLHQPVDFSTELVPWMRDKADLFVAFHRQSDPSCSYLEAMGCGLAVMGSSNAMWTELAKQSQGGWVAPMGQPATMARQIAALNRTDIMTAGERALHYAQDHDFDREFARRIDHLRQLAPALTPAQHAST